MVLTFDPAWSASTGRVGLGYTEVKFAVSVKQLPLSKLPQHRSFEPIMATGAGI